MKLLIKILSITGLLSTIAATTTFADGIFSIDEWGNGTWHLAGSSQITTFVGTLGPDPSGGLLGNVLVYTLGGPMVQGDVLIMDTNSQVSDIVRFWNPQGPGGLTTAMIFYSGLPEPGENPPPADTGLTTVLLPNTVTLTEVGDELSNSASFSAFSSLPGSDGVTARAYVFVSDGLIPEPNTCSLVVLGGGLLFALKRRFQTRK